MLKAPAWKDIRLSDYEYNLPEDRIAKFPLERRDNSKLLHFKNNEISHRSFSDIPELIPAGSLMVYNNTKVIPARLIFQRETGAKIEIFLLKPVKPNAVINEVMIQTSDVSWETMIGNLKKWKSGEVLKGEIYVNEEKIILSAILEDPETRTVRFSWSGNEIPFVTIVEASGEVPLPPYLNRKATAEDKPRYQTVYSLKEGAVAAPTAGLHFTDEVLSRLEGKGIISEYLTLHVGAGTFQPIKEEVVSQHSMHSEQIVVKKSTVEQIAAFENLIVAVGTTSLRSLESIYWFGVKLLNGVEDIFRIPKLFPYQYFSVLPSRKESFSAVVKFMEKKSIFELTGSTEIFIMPGYDFKVCHGLVTNFHQPSSTLILLVAAFTGGNWRKIYEEALNNQYRFLSYGDSSLLWGRE